MEYDEPDHDRRQALDDAVRPLGDGDEHRLKVVGRLCDHLEDVGRGCCCSNASVVSLNSRAFSIAIMA